MRQLGQLEAVVMQRLWSVDRPVSVREVLEDLQRERDIAYTTVMTVLDNLHGKGLVRREKQGRAYLYAPALSREEHTAGLLDQVLSQSGDRGATLLHFVGHMSEDDLAELRSALDHRDPSDAPDTAR
ncbi:BlaI/MecI/CopY family transcriptional regulator [Nocardioides terrigena]|uniref:BlaI/MecI/CopY family transcriptional regulator n=1 Tax=Nocardioides terrigena TaxID=424797 RepID=UPI000D3204E0|nr:BlaI/MecI/CopY family transcriptional regulator [Nocardioides terrigena]